MATPVTVDSIAEAANSPQSASADGQSASAVPIGDQIKALQLQAASDGTSGTNAGGGRKSPWRAAVTARAVPPGAVAGTTDE